MDKNKTKHRLTAADILTLLRMVGTALLAALKPLSGGFLFLYALTGVTDVLDGWIARKTNTERDFGARLDSAADLLFYAVMLLRVFPALWQALPGSIWYAVAFIVLVRLAAYLTAAVKYRRFASLHTYLNKFTGFAVFLIPFWLLTDYAPVFCWSASAVAMVSSLEELVLHLQSRVYNPNTKSFFISRNKACVYI